MLDYRTPASGQRTPPPRPPGPPGDGAIDRRFERLEAALAELALEVRSIPDPAVELVSPDDCIADRLVAILQEAGLVSVIFPVGGVELRGPNDGGLLERIEALEQAAA